MLRDINVNHGNFSVIMYSRNAGADPGICEGGGAGVSPSFPLPFPSPLPFSLPSPLELVPLKPTREFGGAL